MTDLRPIGLFLAILLALTITLYVWLFNGGNAQGVSVLMMLVPAVSAITATIMCKEKLGSLGWRLGKLKYLGYAFLVPLIVAFIGYGLVWIFKFAGFYTTEVVNYKWATMVGFELPAPFFVAIAAKVVLGSLMYFVFILGEEIGWSGFLTKRLLKDYSVLKVSLMVGLFWSVWHFPAVIHGEYANYGVTKWVALVGLTLNLTGMTFFRTILIARAGTLWCGAVLHLSHNLILTGIFWDLVVKDGNPGYLVAETGLFLGVVYIIAGLVAVRFHKISHTHKAVTRHVQTPT